jgi:hypothetical protein
LPVLQNSAAFSLLRKIPATHRNFARRLERDANNDIDRVILLRRAAMADFPTIIVRNYAELVDALARVKNFLQLSNETVELN